MDPKATGSQYNTGLASRLNPSNTTSDHGLTNPSSTKPTDSLSGGVTSTPTSSTSQRGELAEADKLGSNPAKDHSTGSETSGPNTSSTSQRGELAEADKLGSNPAQDHSTGSDVTGPNTSSTSQKAEVAKADTTGLNPAKDHSTDKEFTPPSNVHASKTPGIPHGKDNEKHHHEQPSQAKDPKHVNQDSTLAKTADVKEPLVERGELPHGKDTLTEPKHVDVEEAKHTPGTAYTGDVKAVDKGMIFPFP